MSFVFEMNLSENYSRSRGSGQWKDAMSGESLKLATSYGWLFFWWAYCFLR